MFVTRDPIPSDRTSLTLLSPAALGADTFSSSVPADTAVGSTRVWVNAYSGVYRCAGDRWYGITKQGAYMSEAEARDHGYRPAYGEEQGPAAL